jgi:hypothetical protein
MSLKACLLHCFQTIDTPEEEQEHGTPEAFVSTPNNSFHYCLFNLLLIDSD